MRIITGEDTNTIERFPSRMAANFKNGRIFFTPPSSWTIERFETAVQRQGACLIPENASDEEVQKIKQSDKYYQNIIQAIRKYDKV